MTCEMLRLLESAPPPSRPVYSGTPTAWNAVECMLGSSLPSDYKWLIETYGSGDFCDLLLVLSPFAPSGGLNLVSQVNPILEHYRFGGAGRCPFVTFPDAGGLLPVAQDTNGGDLFWLTEGAPDDWHLVHFDWGGGWQYARYSMGLVEFLVRWIDGHMPESFFGVGTDPRIVRRDPVFCPFGVVRPPRDPGSAVGLW